MRNYRLIIFLNILSNVRKDADIKNPHTGQFLELDLWIPSSQLCFEFQDDYHYVTTWYSHIPLRATKLKDYAIRMRGETLIVVPCWWDGQVESLVETIKIIRPEIEFSYLKNFRISSPIPLNPPHGFFVPYGVPDVGELMLASFPSDKFFQDISRENNWWVGEKYDGIRTCWHPEHKTLYARSGLELVLPPSFKNHFSDLFMDCEIWFGRGEFPEAVKLMGVSDIEVYWQFFRTVTFDYASPEGQREIFEDRYNNLLVNTGYNNPFVIVAGRMKCETKKRMGDMMYSVVNDGGEGVIARKPKSFYEHGRSQHLFKIKASRGDKEALLVDIVDDHFVLQLPDGIIFKVDTTDYKSQKRHLPKPGDVVTFTYDNYSRRAAPVNAKLQRVRDDVAWEHVVAEFFKESSTTNPDLEEENLSGETNEEEISFTTTNTAKKSKSAFTAKPQGYWSNDKGKNMRLFFESYARSVGKDPLLPDTWYPIRPRHLRSRPGLNAIMTYYSNVPLAIINLFPDVPLDESKFLFHSTFSRWQDIGKRREFFVNFATSRDFDPLVAANWYKFTPADIESIEGAESLLANYKGSVGMALTHLFPDVEIDSSRFPYFPNQHWKEKSNRRLFFEKYAEKQHFDPLIPDNWYNLSHSILMRERCAGSVFSYYKGSYSLALIDLFPEIGLQLAKFNILPKHHWQKPDNRKRFFLKFAELRKMDPLIASNWYAITPEDLIQQKGSGGLLDYYNGSFSAALVDLFPRIGLEPHKFNLPKRYWKEEYNRRKFFDNVAKKLGFEPLKPDNWYQINGSTILKFKGAQGVLERYKGSYVTALTTLYPNIGLEKHKFSQMPYNYWGVETHRREFFEHAAKELNFNPHLASSWYSIKPESLLGRKGARAVIAYHKNFIRGLCELFPEIKFDRSRFVFLNDYDWKESPSRREFFIRFANENLFDPLIAENWYSISSDMFFDYPDAQSMLKYYHKGNFVSALVDLFPDVAIDSSKFSYPPKFWLIESNRRQFMMEVATQKGLDPLVPDTWYSLSTSDLTAKLGMKSLLEYYSWNFATALTNLFPTLSQIDLSRLPNLSRKFWQDYRFKRIFTNYAKQKGFDPLEPAKWYSISKTDAAVTRHLGVAIRYYGSFYKALTRLFPEVKFERGKVGRPTKKDLV